MNTISGKDSHFTAGLEPSIVSAALWRAAGNGPTRILTPAESAQLAVISSVVRFGKGQRIYTQGEQADAVFNIVTGVVKTYMPLAGGAQHIVAFLFPGDLDGLARDGRFVNSADAVTAVTAYRIPAVALEALFRTDGALEFQLFCKLCDQLRQAQRHAFVLSMRSAAAKLGLFLQMLEAHRDILEKGAAEIYLPMSRSDIAAYLGTSLEAVSRSFQALVDRRVLAFRDRRHLKIVDRTELATLIAKAERPLRRRVPTCS
jgi:CRP-like cAMP-binding protein